MAEQIDSLAASHWWIEHQESAARKLNNSYIVTARQYLDATRLLLSCGVDLGADLQVKSEDGEIIFFDEVQLTEKNTLTVLKGGGHNS